MRYLVLLLALCACSSVTEPTTKSDCTLTQSHNQGIPSGQRAALRFETSNCFSVDLKGSRITVPPGRWLVMAQLTWSPGEQGLRGMSIMVNGVALANAGTQPMPDGVVTTQALAALVTSETSSTIEITATQTSGYELVAVHQWPGSKEVWTFARIVRID